MMKKSESHNPEFQQTSSMPPPPTQNASENGMVHPRDYNKLHHAAPGVPTDGQYWVEKKIIQAPTNEVTLQGYEDTKFLIKNIIRRMVRLSETILRVNQKPLPIPPGLEYEQALLKKLADEGLSDYLKLTDDRLKYLLRCAERLELATKGVQDIFSKQGPDTNALDNIGNMAAAVGNQLLLEGKFIASDALGPFITAKLIEYLSLSPPVAAFISFLTTPMMIDSTKRIIPPVADYLAKLHVEHEKQMALIFREMPWMRPIIDPLSFGLPRIMGIEQNMKVNSSTTTSISSSTGRKHITKDNSPTFSRVLDNFDQRDGASLPTLPNILPPSSSQKDNSNSQSSTNEIAKPHSATLPEPTRGENNPQTSKDDSGNHLIMLPGNESKDTKANDLNLANDQSITLENKGKKRATQHHRKSTIQAGSDTIPQGESSSNNMIMSIDGIDSDAPGSSQNLTYPNFGYKNRSTHTSSTRSNPSIETGNSGKSYPHIELTCDDVGSSDNSHPSRNLDIRLDGIHASSSIGNYRVGATVDMATLPNAIYSTGKYIKNKISDGMQNHSKKQTLKKNEKSFIKLEKSFIKHANADESNHHHEMSLDLRRSIQSCREIAGTDGEKIKLVDAVEWAANDKTVSPRQYIKDGKKASLDVDSLKGSYQHKIDNYLKEKYNALLNLDIQRALNMEKTTNSIPRDIKCQYSECVRLLMSPNKYHSNEIERMQKQATEDGYGNLFESLMTKIAQKKSSEAIPRPQPPSDLEQPVQFNHDAAPDAVTQQPRLETAPGHPTISREDLNKREFKNWCIFQGAEYATLLIPDRETSVHARNGIRLARSTTSLYYSHNSFSDISGPFISLADIANRYTFENSDFSSFLATSNNLITGFSICSDIKKMVAPSKNMIPTDTPSHTSLLTSALALAGPPILNSMIGDKQEFGYSEVSTTYVSYVYNSTTSFIKRNSEIICSIPGHINHIYLHSDLICGTAHLSDASVYSGYSGFVVDPGTLMQATAGTVAPYVAGALVLYCGYSICTRHSDPGFVAFIIEGNLNNAVYNQRKGKNLESEQCILEAYGKSQTNRQTEDVFSTAYTHGLLSQQLCEQHANNYISNNPNSIPASLLLLRYHFENNNHTEFMKHAKHFDEFMRNSMSSPQNDENQRKSLRHDHDQFVRMLSAHLIRAAENGVYSEDIYNDARYFSDTSGYHSAGYYCSRYNFVTRKLDKPFASFCIYFGDQILRSQSRISSYPVLLGMALNCQTQSPVSAMYPSLIKTGGTLQGARRMFNVNASSGVTKSVLFCNNTQAEPEAPYSRETHRRILLAALDKMRTQEDGITVAIQKKEGIAQVLDRNSKGSNIRLA